jgi:PAS domain S-box-containing protein
MSSIELLQRQLERERVARKEAERILEEKSLELYRSNMELTKLNASLETQVQQRTNELRFEQSQLNLLIDLHPMPLLLVKRSDFTIMDVNAHACFTFRKTKESFIGLPYLDWSKAIEGEQPSTNQVDGEREIILGDQRLFYQAHSTSLNFRNEDVYLIILDDLADRKAILKQYIEKEKAYRELVENVSDIIYRADQTGRFTYINPTAAHFTGYTENELLDAHFTMLVREDFQAKLISYYQFQLQEEIQTTYIEFPVITKNGEEKWVGQSADLHRIDDETIEFIVLCRDITDRKKVERALIRSEEKYRSIIENLELGLLEVDPSGTIVKAYPKFCDLTGYSPEELVGHNPLQFLVDEKGREVITSESQKRKKGQASVYEVELIRKDGSKVWVIISGAPFYNERNEVAGTVGIHLDISDRKKMEEELLFAKEIAENSLRSKDQFVANISHEIRTPLNAIIGMNQLLNETGLTEKQHSYAEAIETSSQNLLTIVNDLLDFSKIESGKMELEIISGNLHSVIRKTIQLWNLKIEEKGLYFEQNIHPDINRYYLFDPTRLSSILSNLLHNALKFTAHGKLSILVELLERNKNSDRIRFAITDTGIGIPNEKLSTIFESFVQAENNTTRNFGGTGLGLSIAKDLVELMNGQLTVSSEVDKGSCFQFILELPHGKEPVLESAQNFDLSQFKDKRVLLVEDNEINRFMAQTILENWKLHVTCAENGAIAVEKLTYHPFDVVLMDMQMPVLDGLQATWVIRNKLNSDTPIIALTANAVKGELEKCVEVGMNDFLSKPYTQEALQAALIRALKLQPSVIQKSTTEKQPIASDWIDLSLLIQNTNNNEQFMRKMIQLMISETEQRLEEIPRLLQLNDQASIRSIAHSMKPSIDHVAHANVRELVRKVEAGNEVFEVFSQQTSDLIHALKNVLLLLKDNQIVTDN